MMGALVTNFNINLEILRHKFELIWIYKALLNIKKLAFEVSWRFLSKKKNGRKIKSIKICILTFSNNPRIDF